MNKIEMGRTYRTRDGREVRIYAVDGAEPYSVHGAVREADGWSNEEWSDDGKWDRLNQRDNHNTDLIEVRSRIKREVWVNVYPTDVYAYRDKELADYAGSSSTRIACVKLVIDCEEGEGTK